MPRPFDERERSAIRQRLRAVGREQFGTRGLRKTTIADLARAAGIAKGSFYLFFASKEDLFFQLLEEVQNELRGPMLEPDEVIDANPEPAFREFLRRMVDAFESHPILMVLTREDELAALMRRLPPAQLEEHSLDDQKFIQSLVERWQRSGRFRAADPEAVSALVTLMVLSALHRDFVGERLYPVVSEMMIDLLCRQFFEPSGNRSDIDEPSEDSTP